MDTLLDLEVDPSEAYNTVQGTHNMAGKNVIAAMDARFVEINANFSEIKAMIKSLEAEVRLMNWLLGFSVAFVGTLITVVVALFLYRLPGDPAPTEVTVSAAVAEESDPSARPPATDPEEPAAEDAPQ